MKNPHPFVPLTLLQHQALTGLMLGDGHLSKGDSNINAHLMVGRATKDIDYLKYEIDIFENFLSPMYRDKIPGYSSYISEDTGKLIEFSNFSTSACPAFTPYYSKWYQEQEEKTIKIVPLDLQLDPVIIAHWICDDGSVCFNKLSYRLKIEFATHGFTQTEVIFLAGLLQDRYNEEFLVRGKNRKGKKYWIIRAYDSACRVMFADIDTSFKMTRKRIWDKPESRFYNDPPERQRSTVKDYAARKEWARKFVEAGQPMTMKEIDQCLGYFKNDKDKIDYASINSILKPYLDSGKIYKDVDKNNNNTTTVRIIK
jgi:LAGLIDADG DNA endonuclease family protein